VARAAEHAGISAAQTLGPAFTDLPQSSGRLRPAVKIEKQNVSVTVVVERERE